MAQWSADYLPYVESYDTGLGVLRSTGEPRNKSIKGTAIPVVPAPGGHGDTLVVRVETTEALETELGINASARGGFGIYKADNKFEFSKKCQLQTYSLAIVVHSTQRLGFFQIDELELTDAAKALATSDPQGFVRVYGDCFFRGLQRGGELFVVIRIDTSSQESRETVKDTLNAAVGAFSAEAMVSLSESVKRTNSRTSILLHNDGGSAVPSSLNSPADVANVLKPWVDSLVNWSVPTAMTLASYEIVNGFNPPSVQEIEHQRDVLQRCSSLRYYALNGLNEVEFALENAGVMVGGVDAATLNAARTGFAQDLDVIAEAAVFAVQHPNEALEPEDYAITKLGRPGYKLTVLPSPMPQLAQTVAVTPPAFGHHPLYGYGDESQGLAEFTVTPWSEGAKAPVGFWGPLPPQVEPSNWPFWTSTFNLEGATRIAVIGWMPVPARPAGTLNSAVIRVHGRLALPEQHTFRLVASLVEFAPHGQLAGYLDVPTFLPSWTTRVDISNSGEFDLSMTLVDQLRRPKTLDPTRGTYFIELALLQEGDFGDAVAVGIPEANQIEIYEVVFN